MEKHISTFCKQNPTFDHKCQKCKTLNKIPMKDLLKIKYKYVMTCKKCGTTTTIDTHELHKSLNTLKKFS